MHAVYPMLEELVTIAKSTPDLSGAFNGSMQHWIEANI
jgi:hypothetical protein